MHIYLFYYTISLAFPEIFFYDGMGIEKSQETVDELTKEAVNALGVFDGDTSFLEKLAYKLALRKK